MALTPNLQDREQGKFVESPSRPNGASVEVVSPTLDLIYSENAGMTYVGEAEFSSSTASAVWRIFRFNSSTGRISYASTQFNQVWNDRESLTYV